MAALTIDDIKALDFGYITGVDLLFYSPSQMLIKQETSNTGIIENAVMTAQSELIAKLSSKVDITSEYNDKTGTGRSMQVVKLTCALAVYNLSYNLAGEPEKVKEQREVINAEILAIRNGQSSMPMIQIAESSRLSESVLIGSKFQTLG